MLNTDTQRETCDRSELVAASDSVSGLSLIV